MTRLTGGCLRGSVRYLSANAPNRSTLCQCCSKCGTPLTYWHEGWPDEIALSIGSMDAPNEAPPH